MTRRRLSGWQRVWRVIRTELRRATRDRQAEHERRSAAARKAAVTRKARKEPEAQRLDREDYEQAKKIEDSWA